MIHPDVIVGSTAYYGPPDPVLADFPYYVSVDDGSMVWYGVDDKIQIRDQHAAAGFGDHRKFARPPARASGTGAGIMNVLFRASEQVVVWREIAELYQDAAAGERDGANQQTLLQFAAFATRVAAYYGKFTDEASIAETAQRLRDANPNWQVPPA